MEIRVLNYFLTVANMGNITKAADALHITQPTLSRQLMQLEEELGTQLLIRGKRQIELTEDGLLLKRRAEEIKSLVDQTELELHQSDQHISGRIVIGTGITNISQKVLPDMMMAFQDLYPDVIFDIYTGNADLISERIQKGLVDVGFLLEPADFSHFHYMRLNQEEKWGAVMSNHHPLALHDNVLASDLKDEVLFVTDRINAKREVDQWFKNQGVKPNYKVTYNFITSVIPLIQKQKGIAFSVEGGYLPYCGQDITFVPVYPSLTTSSVMVWKKETTMSPVMKKWLEFVRDYPEEA